MPGWGTAKYIQTPAPWGGLAESVATSNVIFTGDAAMVNYSLTTSSATASRWTWQGNNGDGFTSALDAGDWFSVKAVTAQGFHSFDTIPRWVRLQRTPSHSSSTVLLAIYVGV